MEIYYVKQYTFYVAKRICIKLIILLKIGKLGK